MKAGKKENKIRDFKFLFFFLNSVVYNTSLQLLDLSEITGYL